MGINTVKCKPEFQTNTTRFNGLFASYIVENASHFWIMKILAGKLIITNVDDTFEYTAYSPSRMQLDKSTIESKLKQNTKG